MDESNIGFTPIEIWQNLDEELSSGITVSPRQARRYFLSSLVARSLSFLMGWNYSTGDPVKLSCMPDGSLRTTSLGTGFTTQLPTTLNLAASDSQTITFTKTTARLDIWAVGGDLSIERSTDGVTFQSAFTLYSGGYLSVDAQQLAVKITNLSTTAANTGQIIGWY